MELKKIYWITGEASGDLHSANVLKALRQKQPNLQVRGMGGDLCKAQGMDIFIDYKTMNFMGFVEVVQHLPRILKNLSRIKKDMLAFKPDAVVLVDYPGLNLKLAKFAHLLGIKVYYYISPQIWAWKQSRVHTIRKYVDRMICILPFEPAFYQKFGVDVSYVGHPLLDALHAQPVEPFEHNRPYIALLPGSRHMEVKRMLPLMIKMAQQMGRDYDFIIAAAPGAPTSWYTQAIAAGLKVEHNQTYAILKGASGAVVTSGTATLETALLQTPQIVVYKANALSVWLARKLIKVSYISLVNLIMDQPVVAELIQEEAEATHCISKLKAVLPGGTHHDEIKRAYRILTEKLNHRGASERAAALIWKDYNG